MNDFARPAATNLRKLILGRSTPPPAPTLESATSALAKFEHERDSLFAAVLNATGFDLHCYLNGRIWPQSIPKLCTTLFGPDSSPLQLAEQVSNNPVIAEQVINALLISHSSFFRGDPEDWKMIEGFLQDSHSKHAPLRVLSAGCSSGHEPYSIAIMAYDLGIRNIEIYGWDQNEPSLRAADEALYCEGDIRNIHANSLLEHFSARTINGFQRFKLKPHIKSLVSYEKRDLLAPEDFTPPPFDIVMCRNVKMHLVPESRIDLDIALADLVSPGGLYVTDPDYEPEKPFLRRLEPTKRNGIFTKTA